MDLNKHTHQTPEITAAIGVCVCVCVYLQDGHLVPQLTLLLGGEAQLVDDFDGHVPASLPVLSCEGDEM